MESLSRHYRISVFANRILDRVRLDEPFVSRCWIADAADTPMSQLQCLADEIADAGCEAVSIQYNLGLFSPASVSALMRLLKERNIASLVTLHASIDQRSEEVITALQVADRVIVHRRDEQEKARAGGLAHVSLQQQGIYVPKSLQRKNNPGEMADSFVLSCFGFFLPPKGIYELLQAFETAAFTNPALRLKLLNALYDHPHSRPYASLCERFIRRHKLMDRVLVCTEFLDQDTVLQELAASDLVVLPYTVSTEASSAAIRLPLASLTPVLCSDIRLFKEFDGLVHFYPAQDLIALANRILELSADSRLLTSFSLEQRRYVDNVSWTNVARQFEAIVESCIPRQRVLPSQGSLT
jgi:glycosyltransferase involved in cell wall biosynthesis